MDCATHARGRLFVAVGFSDHRGFVVLVLLVVVFVFVFIIVASVQKDTSCERYAITAGEHQSRSS